MQNAPSRHDTADRPLPDASEGFGLGMVDQIGDVRPDAATGSVMMPVRAAARSTPILRRKTGRVSLIRMGITMLFE
jgi:hypothetical protein